MLMCALPGSALPVQATPQITDPGRGHITARCRHWHPLLLRAGSLVGLQDENGFPSLAVTQPELSYPTDD